jgi:hypothetical protein
VGFLFEMRHLSDDAPEAGHKGGKESVVSQRCLTGRQATSSRLKLAVSLRPKVAAYFTFDTKLLQYGLQMAMMTIDADRRRQTGNADGCVPAAGT